MGTERLQTRPLLVYVVEGQPATAATLAAILRSGGCQVKTFADGGEFVTHRAEAPPDVVVTEFVLHPMDGLKIAAWVRTAYPQARLVMITDDEQIVRQSARQALPFPVIEKPFRSVALLAAVHGVEWNEAPDFPAA